MSIKAMKQALEALENPWGAGPEGVANAITALRTAITEAEKQEAVAIGEEWKPCVKLPIVVHVREQRKGETHVSTREGITPVKEDDLIMRGVAGEEYPIGRELFNRTYTFDIAPPKRAPLTDAEFAYVWHQVTRRIMGTDKEILLHAKRITEAAHGIKGEA